MGWWSSGNWRSTKRKAETPPLLPTSDIRDPTSLRPALLLIAGVTIARVLYVVLGCPYDLIEDEAHYWLWAQHLDWSYYTKGPGVAWVIWLSTSVLGDAEWAVRIPAVLASAVTMLAAAALARDVSAHAGARPPRSALFSVPVLTLIAVLSTAALQLTAVLMTIDGPYVACWALACWAGWRALERRSAWAWVVLGAALGAGFLFKYTIVLLVPGLLIYAIARRRTATLHPRWKIAAAAGAAMLLLGLAPIVIWNAQNEWVTVKHLLGHLGVRGGDMPVAVSPEKWSPTWTLEFIGTQFGLIGPVLVLALFASNRSIRRRGKDAARFRGDSYLIACAAPILVFYLGVSFIAEPEGNWPLAGYVTLLIVAARRAAEVVGQRDPELRGTFHPVRATWRGAIVFGLIAAVFLHRIDLVAAAATRLTMWPPVAWVCLQLGYAPRTLRVGRLIGAKERAEHAAELMSQLAAASKPGERPPLLVADHYGRASQMAYYLSQLADERAIDQVLCASAYLGGRQSQFDVWPRTRLSNPEFVGRNALLLSNDKPEVQAVWERLFAEFAPIAEPPGNRLRGEHKKDRVAFFGFGYKGIGGGP